MCNSNSPDEGFDDASPPANNAARVAFAGNSMIYYQDTPRFFANLAGDRVADQDCCLRGGASLPSLLSDGNGMRNKFRSICTSEEDIGSPTVQALLSRKRWNFLVMNDYTQAPARVESREKTIRSLLNDYLPLMMDCGAIPVFIITPAYRRQVNNSSDLGTVEDFTKRTKEGCEEYASQLKSRLPEKQAPRVAPVGLAYIYVRNDDPKMWEKLFHIDDFHPSPHGTFLQGCVLHWTLFGCGPDRKRVVSNVKALWENARLMQPPKDEELPIPTLSEADYLYNVAEKVSNLGKHSLM